jgi:hypothetical protein
MKLWDPYKAEISLPDELLSASQEGLCSMEFVSLFLLNFSIVASVDKASWCS